MKTRYLTRIALLALLLALGSATYAGTAYPETISVVPQPFWSTLRIFRSEPKVSLILLVPSVTQSQPNYAAVNTPDLDVFAGFNDNSEKTPAPIVVIPLKAEREEVSVAIEPAESHPSTTSSGPSLAETWSRTPGVGSTIPTYESGFGTASANSSTSLDSGSTQLVGSDLRATDQFSHGKATVTRPDTQSVPLAGSDIRSQSFRDGSSVSIGGITLTSDASKIGGARQVIPKALIAGIDAPTANTTNSYTGSSSGSLLTAGNWSLGHVPTVSEDAVFTATTGIRTLTAGNLTVGSFNVTANTGTFSIRNETTGGTNSTLTLGGAGNLGNQVSGNAADLLYVAAGSTFSIIGPNGGGGTGVLNLALGQSGNFDVAGTMSISAIISGSGFGFTKTGAGTLTLSATNTYTGPTTINSGTLSLAPAGTAAVINSGSALGLGGGTLNISFMNDGTQTFNGMTINPGASSIVTIGGNGGHPTTLTLGAITRNLGGTLDFTQSGTGSWTTTSPNDANGLLGPGITVAGNNWATKSGSNIVAFSGYTTQNAVGSWAANQNITNNGPFTGSLGGNLTINSLRFNANTATGPNLGSSTLTVLDGILITSNLSSQGETISGGSLRGSAGGDLVLINNGVGTTSLTISSTIVDNTSATALTKSGLGSVVLTGANTYTGTTYINAGTLQIGNASASGSLGTGAIVDNGTLSFNRTDAIAVGNNISGAGSLTQAGGGTTTLSGTNSYSGGTSINAGTLSLGSSGALGSSGNISFSGGTLQYSASNTTDYSGRFSTANSQGYSIDTNGQTVTFGSALTSAGGTLTKLGSGTLILSGGSANTFNLTTTIDAGELDLNKTAGLNAIAGNITIGDGSGTDTLKLLASNQIADTADITVGTSGVFDVNGNVETIDGLTAAGSTASVTLGSGSLTIGAGGATATFAGVISGSGGSLVKAGGSTQTLTGANTYSGATTINAGTLQLGNGGTTGSLSASSAISINNTANFTINRSNTVTQGTDFSGGITGSGSFTQAGSGTTILNTANSYTGTTTVSAGVLNIQNGSALGATSPGGTNVSSGGTLQLQGGITVGAETLTINGTGASGQNGALVNVSGTNNYGGQWSLTGATTISSDADTLNMTYTGNIGGAFNLMLGGAGNGSISGNIATSGGSLTKNGAGTWTLSGANTYTGITTISAGALNIQNNTGLGTVANGTSVTSGAALQLQNGIVVGNEALTLNGTGISNGGALRNISGANVWQGTVTLGSATRINSDAGTLTFNTAANSITGTQNLTLGGPGNGTIAGTITIGTGTLSMDGVGTWTFSGTSANTYTGVTTVNAGELDLNKTAGVNAVAGNITLGDGSGTDTVKLLAANQIINTSDLTIDSSGVLDLNGNAETIDGLSGVAGASVTLGSGTLTIGVTNEASATFAGMISGSGGALVKTGTGTQTLSGSNTYTGGTTVSGGTLALGANDVLADSGSLSVGGGTFSFSTFSDAVGALTLTGSGILSGTSGTLTTSGVTVTGTGNSISGGTVIGAITQNAGSALTVNGTADSDSLAAGSTGLSGTGTVGVVTMNGSGNSLSSSGTLTTGGIAINNTGNTLSSGTVVGNVTFGGGAALVINGALTGSVTVGTGTLSGSGSVSGTTGVTGGTINGGGLTLSGLVTFNGGGNTLSGTETASNGVNLAGGASLTQSGTLTGAINLVNGATSLTGSGTVGAVTLNGGGNTIAGSGTLTTSGLTINSTNNTLTSGIVSGAITQNASSALTVNGTAGNDSLANLATLNGTGSVGIVTLAGNNTLSSGGILTTGGITVNGTGNSISSGTVTGNITQNASSALTVDGAAIGSDSMASGATLSGIGSIGAISFAGNNTLSSAGTFTTGLVTVNGSGNSISAGTITGGASINSGGSLNIASGASLGGTTNVAGTLMGTGSVASLNINNGGKLSPGNSVGTISSGNTAYNSGGTYTWEINDATGTAGSSPGWDWNNITGTLTIGSATFTIDVNGLNGASPGLIANFNKYASYDWDIATASSGISGFSAGKFTFDLTDFTNSIIGTATNGAFSIATSGNNLIVHYTGATDAAPATAYWTGDQSSIWSTNNAGDTNWATSAAGTTDTHAAPGAISDVFFTANSASNLTNTLGQDFTINSLTFTGTGTSATAGVTISGNTLTINAASGTGITVDSGSGFDTINSDIVLGGNQSWINNSGNSFAVTGDVSGGFGITKRGSGILLLSGTNSYTGDTTIAAGELQLTPSGSLAAASTIRLGDTIANSPTAMFNFGATSGGNTVASPLIVQASGSGTTGTRTVLGLAENGNTNTYSGAITMNADLTLQSAAVGGSAANGQGILLLQGGSIDVGSSTLTVNSNLRGNNADTYSIQGIVQINEAITSGLATGGSIFKDGSGTLVIQSTSNTYTGTNAALLNANGTQIGAGILGIYGDGSLGLAPSVATNNLFFTTSAENLNGDSIAPTVRADAGTVTLASTRNVNIANGVTAHFDSNGNSLTVGGVINGAGGNVSKIGAGDLVLNNTNTYTGMTTIDSGTLNAGAAGALGSTSSITVNNSGTLLLSNSGTNNRINDSATMALNGGTFNSGGLSEHGLMNNTPGIGALTLNASSIIDMGNAASIVAFASSILSTWSPTATLSIYNWSGTPATGGGTDQLYFGNLLGGLSSVQLAQFQFYTGAGTGAFLPGAIQLSDGEVVPTIMTPVPEPSTWLAAALTLGLVLWTQRRRVLLFRVSGG